MEEVGDLTGRRHRAFKKRGRAPYRLFETMADQRTVSSCVEQSRATPRSPGYRGGALSMLQVRGLIATVPEDWQSALAEVGGVCLITAQDGRHDVGSASGPGGFWARWTDHAANGHGGHDLLKALLKEFSGAEEGFHFAILETAAITVGPGEVFRREAHWTRVLGSRAQGLNLN